MSAEFDDHFHVEAFRAEGFGIKDREMPRDDIFPPFQGPWQDWRMEDVPDVNGDGKANLWDVLQLLNRKANLTAPDGSGGIYHPETNAVVLYIEKDKQKTPVSRYDYDTKKFGPPTTPSPYVDKPDGFFGM